MATPTHPRRLGGSSIAALLGLSRYTTPLGVYRRMIGEDDGAIDPDIEAFGLAAEPAILESARRQIEQREREQHGSDTEVRLDTQNRMITVQSDDDDDPPTGHNVFPADVVPYVGGEVDGLIWVRRYGVENGTRAHVVDAKLVAAPRWDSPPMEYVLQMLWYMGLMSMTEDPGIIAATHMRSGVRTPVLYEVEWRPDVFARCKAEAIAFIRRHVIPRIPPAPTTRSEVIEVWPEDDGEVVPVPDSLADTVDAWLSAKAQLADLDAQAKPIKATLEAHADAIAAAIGPHRGMAHGDSVIAAKRVHRRGYTVEPSVGLQLRIEKPKRARK